MDQGEDPRDLERKIEQASRIASRVNDRTTYQRLTAWVEEIGPDHAEIGDHEQLAFLAFATNQRAQFKRLLGLNFTLMTKLDGSILGQMETSLASEQRFSAYAQIGGLLREFHRIPMEAFGYIGPSGIWTAHPTNRVYLTHQFQRKLKEFTERGGDAGLARKVAGHSAERAALFGACTHAVLCHNDLHAGNLLATVTNESIRLTGVLDFEGALAGDPLMDVAKALYYLDAESRRALLQGYGAMDREHWSQTLDLYHLYFVLELWCWMAQIGNQQPLQQLALDLERYSTS